MIDRQHDLSIRQQVRLLNISRGCVYYQSRETSTTDLTIMRRMDELHLDHPFAGSRMLRDLLRREGHNIGRRHVRGLMRKMGLQTLYRKPNLSKPATGHRIYPYLLRGIVIDRPNQVWATDITYIPMAKGFVYLCAIIDWHSRKVLSHSNEARPSNLLTNHAAVIHRHGFLIFEHSLKAHARPLLTANDLLAY